MRQARDKVGENPEIVALRVGQLRQARDLLAAIRVLTDAGDDTRRCFCLWSQLMQTLITTGEYEAAEIALRDNPAQTTVQLSLVSLFSGRIAEAQWRLSDAAFHYQKAVALNSNHSQPHVEAARLYLKLLDLDASGSHLCKAIKIDASARILRGQATNVSQTHIGQLIDEFSLDASLLHKLKHIRKMPRNQQLSPLRDLVQSNADFTPAAIMFLIALRQTGLLRGNVGTGFEETGPIPRRIVQYWDTGEPPNDVRLLMQSWIEFGICNSNTSVLTTRAPKISFGQRIHQMSCVPTIEHRNPPNAPICFGLHIYLSRAAFMSTLTIVALPP